MSRREPTSQAPWYPVFLDLRGRPVLVVGGGPLAAEKVRGLRAAEAEITVVAAALNTELTALRDAGEITHLPREYRDGDMAGFAVVMAAQHGSAGGAALNGRLSAEARARGILLNAADDPANCDFILPAVVRAEPLTIAVSTGGGSPAVARRVREELSEYLSAETASLAELVAEVRADLRRRNVFRPITADAWQAAMDGRLRALLAQRRRGQAKALLLARLGAPLRDRAEPNLDHLLAPCRAAPER